MSYQQDEPLVINVKLACQAMATMHPQLPDETREA